MASRDLTERPLAVGDYCSIGYIADPVRRLPLLVVDIVGEDHVVVAYLGTMPTSPKPVVKETTLWRGQLHRIACPCGLPGRTPLPEVRWRDYRDG
jgi:hypothetical protein